MLCTAQARYKQLSLSRFSLRLWSSLSLGRSNFMSTIVIEFITDLSSFYVISIVAYNKRLATIHTRNTHVERAQKLR